MHGHNTHNTIFGVAACWQARKSLIKGYTSLLHKLSVPKSFIIPRAFPVAEIVKNGRQISFEISLICVAFVRTHIHTQSFHMRASRLQISHALLESSKAMFNIISHAFSVAFYIKGNFLRKWALGNERRHILMEFGSGCTYKPNPSLFIFRIMGSNCVTHVNIFRFGYGTRHDCIFAVTTISHVIRHIWFCVHHILNDCKFILFAF